VFYSAAMQLFVFAAQLAGMLAAQERDFEKVEIKVVPVAGSVYMLQGAGGNIGVSSGEDGIVIVDDQFAPLAQKIRTALKGIADRPVRFVLNTHWHGDHTGGNEKLSGEATIIAHENVRKRLAAGAPSMNVGGHDRPAIPPAPKGALPIITFDTRLNVHLNGEDIRAVHFPHAHTDGDVVIWFTKSKVVHMGDNFVTYGFPFIDLRSGGSLKGLIAHLDRLIPELPADIKIIPGHGNVSTVEDLKKFTATLKEVTATVEAEVKKGKKPDDMKKAKILAKWDAAWGQGFIKTDSFIDMAYQDLTKPNR
jgi:cyclase